jgi:hypothetical protein
MTLFPPEAYELKRAQKASILMYEQIDVPPGFKAPWKFQQYLGHILDLLNEEFDTRDLSTCDYEDFITDIELAYDSQKKWTVKETMVFPAPIPAMEQAEYERQQILLMIDIADRLLDFELGAVLGCGS